MKKIEKKLSLKKELIANLNTKQLTEIKGGGYTQACPSYGCPHSVTCPTVFGSCGGGQATEIC